MNTVSCKDAEMHTTAQIRACEENKPRFPLTSYNLFLQIIRKRILEGKDTPGRTITPEEAQRVALDYRNKPHKRRHRKTKGMIGFGGLSRAASSRWKKLDIETKRMLEKQSISEKEIYMVQMKAWNHMMSTSDSIDHATSQIQVQVQQQQQTIPPVFAASEQPQLVRFNQQQPQFVQIDQQFPSVPNASIPVFSYDGNLGLFEPMPFAPAGKAVEVNGGFPAHGVSRISLVQLLTSSASEDKESVPSNQHSVSSSLNKGLHTSDYSMLRLFDKSTKDIVDADSLCDKNDYRDMEPIPVAIPRITQPIPAGIPSDFPPFGSMGARSFQHSNTVPTSFGTLFDFIHPEDMDEIFSD